MKVVIKSPETPRFFHYLRYEYVLIFTPDSLQDLIEYGFDYFWSNYVFLTFPDTRDYHEPYLRFLFSFLHKFLKFRDITSYKDIKRKYDDITQLFLHLLSFFDDVGLVKVYRYKEGYVIFREHD